MNAGKLLVVTFQEARPAAAELERFRRAAAAGGEAVREETLYGDELDVALFSTWCRTPDLMGARRLFILRRMEKMPAAARRELFPALEKLPERVWVILLFETDREPSLPAWLPRSARRFFPVPRAEVEFVDSFGLGRALRRGDRRRALAIIDRQCQSEYRDFPRLFGIVAWSLRSRVEQSGRLDAAAAAAFARLLALERGVRRGRIGGRVALELAVIALLAGRS